MADVLAFARGQLAGMFFLGQLFALLIILETVLPTVGPKPSLRSRTKSLLFWAIWVSVGGALMTGLSPILARIQPHPMFPTYRFGLIGGSLLALYAGDFFYYWFHRAQHTFPILWRFHAVHHSVREMSGVTAYHHISEPVLKAVLYGLPLAFFTNDAFGIPLVGALLQFHGHYLHSNTVIHFGPLRALVQDNRFHRIHHSLQPEHYDKNFGVFTPIWDVLFRTAVFPVPGEWPPTGIEGVAEPKNLMEFMSARPSGRR